MNHRSEPQEFFVAGGTLWQEAPSYIVRPADAELLRLTLQGEYCDILAARQMGKSSLMVRAAERLRENGARTAIVDISALGGGLSTPEAWFFGFLDELAFQLGLGVDVNSWWEAHPAHNPAQLFNNFLRDVVLVEIQAPVVVFVDEIDSVLGLSFRDEFFAAIRAAYNARASWREFHRLTFVLLGVARPADLILERSRTPYNIGAHVHLSDFTLAELQPFQAVFESVYPSQGAQIVGWVLDWTDGQPYLTQKLCAEIIQVCHPPCTRESVAAMVKRLFLTEEARKESNLRSIRDRIESSPSREKMLRLYRRILQGKPVTDEEHAQAKTELKLSGLVRASPQGLLEVRNRIYRTVFDHAWVEKTLQRLPARQFAWLVALVAVLALLAVGYAIFRGRMQVASGPGELNSAAQSPVAQVMVTSVAPTSTPDLAPTQSLTVTPVTPKATVMMSDYDGVYPVDDRTLLLLHLDGSFEGAQGETGAAAGLEFVPGRYGQGALFETGDSLSYPVAGNLDASQGTLEFWLRPNWDGDAGGNYTLFYWGAEDADAFILRKDEISNLVFDRFFTGAGCGAAANVAGWREGDWHHLAITWQGLEMRLYVDGQEADREKCPQEIQPTASTFTIGSGLGGSQAVDGIIDEVRISDVPRLGSVDLLPAPSPAATSTITSPYAGWISYTSSLGNEGEILLINPSTGQERLVTNNGSIDEGPSFSGDNWKLVYASYRSQGEWELYVYDFHKNTEFQLTSVEGQAHFPAWSPVPGDSRILFEWRRTYPQAATNIWLADAESGALEQLTSGGADSRPKWSPDGKRILFARAVRDTTGDGRVSPSDAVDIYLLDLVSNQETNLTRSAEFDDFNFAWSPDGEWIAFTSLRTDANGDGVINLDDSQDLFLMRADGSGERCLDLGKKTVYSPSWSPDGRFILVTVLDEEGKTALWHFDTRNGDFSQVTAPGGYYHPSYANP
jgi:hypothetical protein